MSQTAAPPNITNPNDRWIGYFYGALGAGFFATKGIVIKLALVENIDAVVTLTWRMIIAVPFFALIGWMGYRDQKRKNPDFRIAPSDLGKVTLIGMLGYYVASYLDFAGLEYITAQFDRLILLTYPFFVMFFGAIFFKRKISGPMILALLISYGGLALIFAHDLALDKANTIIGALLVLGAAMSYAMYQLLAKPLIDVLGARLFTSIAMTAAGISVMIHFSLTHSPSDILVSSRALWLMFAMGTVSTVLPAYLISASIGRIGPEPTAMMGNVSPIVTIALAVTILGEVFTLWHAAGAALVLFGILVFTRAQKRLTTQGKIPPV